MTRARIADREFKEGRGPDRSPWKQPLISARSKRYGDALGDELLLLPYAHQSAHSPYQSSGPIYVRRGVRQATLAPGDVPDCVTKRLMSLRAYDLAQMLVEANVVDGTAVAGELTRLFGDPTADCVHLHNAKPGCYSCKAVREG